MRSPPELLVWVGSASLLILAVIALRALLGRRMGAGLRYALWAAVLLRLLVPVQIFPLPVSSPRPEAGGMQAAPVLPPGGASAQAGAADNIPAAGAAPDAGPAALPADPGPSGPAGPALSVPQVLGSIWLAGGAAAAAALAVSNVCFLRRLKRARRRLAETDSELPVYVAEGLSSPCLFGLFRPAVYLTPEAAADAAMLRHVLAHELTHYRHGDHLWNLLRGLALAVHWWNPLVWLAAVLSRRDGELACDEGALRRLGEGERFAYGRTLLALISVQSRPAGLLSCATTMDGDRKSVVQRVKRIAAAPRRWLWAAAAAAALTALVTVCAFGQAKEVTPAWELWPDGVDTRVYTRDLGGFGSPFTLQLSRDGSFSYYEGGLSSFIGRGTWTRDGDMLCLADKRSAEHLMYFYFTLAQDALVFQAEPSAQFLYVDVADGERFSLTYAGPSPEEAPDAAPAPSPDAAPGESPDSGPEETDLQPVYTFIPSGSSGYIQISGLDCGGAVWSRSNGWDIHSPFDRSKKFTTSDEQLGILTVTDPRFLGGLFSETSGELFALYTPESPGLYLLYGDLMARDAGEPSSSFAVEATVGLAAGAVIEQHARDAEGREMEVSHLELVAAARTLARLIQDSADYYARTLPNFPVVRALDDEADLEHGEIPELLLTYQGKEARFSGLWQHFALNETTLGALTDLDRDGKEEIVVILHEGGGTGASVHGLYVFDADTLAQFDTSGVTQMVLGSIRSSGDGDNFYLSGPGLDAVIPKSGIPGLHGPNGATPVGEALALGNIVNYDIRDGVLHCALPCSSYLNMNYIGSLDVTLEFSRAGGFRCVKAEFALYENAQYQSGAENEDPGASPTAAPAAQTQTTPASPAPAASSGPITSPGPAASPAAARSELCGAYYAEGNLPLFELAFSGLDRARQSGWLNKLYDDGDHAFFSAALRGLGEDLSLIPDLAQRAYAEDETAFFSALSDRMSEAELKTWLDRALADGKWDFQSMLYGKLDMDEEKDAQEEEWARQQTAEYQASGIATDGKAYYYEGQLVHIFLDLRANRSFYTLNIDPAGTVNIKVSRDGNGKITGVSYMTEAEAAELLNDMSASDGA